MTTREMIDKELKEPYRTLALLNMDWLPLCTKDKPETILDAVDSMFKWAHSKEGRRFWSCVRLAVTCCEPYPDPTPFLDGVTVPYVGGPEKPSGDTTSMTNDDLIKAVDYARKHAGKTTKIDRVFLEQLEFLLAIQKMRAEFLLCAQWRPVVH